MLTRRSRQLVRFVFASLAGITVASGVVAGHVRFVTDTSDVGEALQFLVDAFTTPLNAVLLGGGGIGTLVAIVVYLQVEPFQRDVEVFRDVMTGYSDLLSWLLRLGFGLPLVGAGFTGYFLNPVVDPMIAPPIARLFQIGLGFALLFGIATRLAALVGLVAYLLALPAAPLLLFSLEWIPGFLALAVIGSGRPSADQMFKRVAEAEGTFYGRIDPIHDAAGWVNERVDPYEKYVPLIIRVGMGVGFAFLGLFEKLLAPEMALAVVEKYNLTAVVPVSPELWVLGAGLSELALGAAIALGFFTRGSALTAMFVFTLTLFGIPDDPVLAHIGLFSLASALLITGAGPYALDNYIGASKPSAEVEQILGRSTESSD